MSSLSYEVRDGIALVTFDQGAMNTLSGQAIEDIAALHAELAGVHADTPLDGVLLRGNRYGLGAGANIGELMKATPDQLAHFMASCSSMLLTLRAFSIASSPRMTSKPASRSA